MAYIKHRNTLTSEIPKGVALLLLSCMLSICLLLAHLDAANNVFQLVHKQITSSCTYTSTTGMR